MFSGGAAVSACRVGGRFENAISVRVAGQPVRLHESTNQFVLTVSGEAIVLVEISRNRLCLQAVQAKNLVANRLISIDRIGTRPGGDPLTEGCCRCETGTERAPVELRIIEKPAPQFITRGRLPAHMAEGLKQAIVVQTHMHRKRLFELLVMEIAPQGHVTVVEFPERLAFVCGIKRPAHPSARGSDSRREERSRR
jgi:hypothetical protein